MALSDEERSRLEKLEQRLTVDDPDFAARLRHKSRSFSMPRRSTVMLLMIPAGMLIILASIALSFPVMGVVGFILMVAGAVAETPQSPPPKAGPQPPPPAVDPPNQQNPPAPPSP